MSAAVRSSSFVAERRQWVLNNFGGTPAGECKLRKKSGRERKKAKES
jgi:hypothetical protein